MTPPGQSVSSLTHRAGLTWRPMTQDDLDAVTAIAAIAFPDHFEGRDCFANRLAVYWAGCFVLAEGQGSPRGYLIAYPWVAETAPALNTLIEAIPDQAGVMYLHDLVIHPDARAAGHSRAIVKRLAAETRAKGWPQIALVSVNDSAAFWERHGFQVRDTPALRVRLDSYGPNARYMVRTI